jgi:hypothetical protein
MDIQKRSISKIKNPRIQSEVLKEKRLLLGEEIFNYKIITIQFK